MARAFFRRRKSCPFSGKNAPAIDYKDIRLLQARPGVRIAGAVLGRSLYSGAIRPSEVLAIASRKAA